MTRTAIKTPPAATVLKEKGWLPDDVSVIQTSIAGAGNMNLVERVEFSDGQSVILKRARPWVEKFPEIPAPVERASVEAAFYDVVSNSKAGQFMPRHLAFDPKDGTNLLEDLGEGTDGSEIYRGHDIPLTELKAVAEWTAALHDQPVTDPMRDKFQNHSMRILNATHIFDFPLDPDNQFSLNDITAGLQPIANRLQSDTAFKSGVANVRDRYLSTSPSQSDVLLHGDLYPGSWLNTKTGLFVIDPEFCWIGPAEWDVGVLLAHLRLSAQPDHYSDKFMHQYGRPLDKSLVDQIIGIEIMRRIIGVAQLPLNIDLARKTELLDEARHLVIAQR